MNRYLPPTLTHLFFLLTPTAMFAATSVVDVEIDIAVQREGTTITRMLEIRGATEVGLIVTGIKPGDACNVEEQIDGIDLPPIALTSMTLGAAGTGPGPLAGIMRGVGAGGDSVPGMGASRGNSAFGTQEIPRSGDSTTMHYHVPGRSLLRPGQRMTIVVRRPGPGGDRVWTTVLTTPPRGVWRISFGFAFAVMVNPDHEYTTRRDTGNSYLVRRVADPAVVNAIPAFMLHWLANEDQWSNWSWSLTAGLGLDVSNPVVVFGGSLTFNQNISIAAGAMALRLKRLNPQYAEGMRLEESIAPEQLHRMVYGINPFVALTFRFAENLFGR
ncbi:MAG: hypothetical protein JST22_13965 [Bacteroidetes bacterium]|nr:hypothetical protein [Bacteroidota bacterium]